MCGKGKLLLSVNTLREGSTDVYVYVCDVLSCLLGGLDTALVSLFEMLFGRV